MHQPPICPPCRLSGVGRRRAANVRGFTLIELIMVIVILGVLAVFAAPRMFNNDAFNARGFHDETLAYLRYAQKTAVAQRRTVCVTFTTTTSLSLAIASAAATTSCASTGTLTGPKGDSGSSITLSAQGSTSYSSAPTNFYFDGLGQPIDKNNAGAPQATQTFQVVGAPRSITVEAGTGYVHE